MEEPSFYKLGDKTFNCPVQLAINAVSGKWKIMILHRLSTADRIRFGELKKRVVNISEKMLIQQLKELEKSGLVKRKAYAVVPPKVEYCLTAYGRAFIPVIDALRKFGLTFTVATVK